MKKKCVQRNDDNSKQQNNQIVFNYLMIYDTIEYFVHKYGIIALYTLYNTDLFYYNLKKTQKTQPVVPFVSVH